MINKVYNKILELANISSTNDKIEYIKNNIIGDNYTDTILRFLIDPMVTSGIGLKSIKKLKDKELPNIKNVEKDLLYLINYIVNNNTGKEEVMLKALAIIDSLSEDEYVRELFRYIISKSYKDISIGVKTYNKANVDHPIPTWDIMGGYFLDEKRMKDKLKKEGGYYIATEKIDGTRGIKKGNTIKTRKGLPHMADVSYFVDKLNDIFGLDYVVEGEFVIKENKLSPEMTNQDKRRITSSILRSKDKNAFEEGLEFIIFNIVSVKGFDDKYEEFTHEDRLNFIKDKIESYNGDKDGICYVKEEFRIQSNEEVDSLFQKVRKDIEDKGIEGYMLQHNKENYKAGKSYRMMKIKEILTADLKVVGWNKGKSKDRQNSFGSFIVEFPYVSEERGIKGIYNVSVGSGYGKELLKEINDNLSVDENYYNNTVIETRITEISVNKSNTASFSFSRFIDFRDDKSIEDVSLEKHELIDIDGEKYFKKLI